MRPEFQSNYVRKPQPVEAHLVTRENVWDLGDRLGGKISREGFGDRRILIETGNRNKPFEGEWIVFEPSGDYEIYTQDKFFDLFREA